MKTYTADFVRKKGDKERVFQVEAEAETVKATDEGHAVEQFTVLADVTQGVLRKRGDKDVLVRFVNVAEAPEA